MFDWLHFEVTSLSVSKIESITQLALYCRAQQNEAKARLAVALTFSLLRVHQPHHHSSYAVFSDSYSTPVLTITWTTPFKGSSALDFAKGVDVSASHSNESEGCSHTHTRILSQSGISSVYFLLLLCNYLLHCIQIPRELITLHILLCICILLAFRSQAFC